jgi:DNA-directed RNA polymerase subunit L
MQINYVKDEKNEVEIEIESITLAEIIRVYLAKDNSVSFVAWKREHSTKFLVLKIMTDGKSARKALEDAISKIEKDLDKLQSEFKKAK